jgi:hypothetical protein
MGLEQIILIKTKALPASFRTKRWFPYTGVDFENLSAVISEL